MDRVPPRVGLFSRTLVLFHGGQGSVQWALSGAELQAVVFFCAFFATLLTLCVVVYAIKWARDCWYWCRCSTRDPEALGADRVLRERREDAEACRQDADLPSYTTASGLPSYAEAIEQLMKAQVQPAPQDKSEQSSGWVPKTPPTPKNISAKDLIPGVHQSSTKTGLPRGAKPVH